MLCVIRPTLSHGNPENIAQDHADAPKANSLLDLIGFTTSASELIYNVADLRKNVRLHSIRVREAEHQGRPAVRPGRLGIFPGRDERMVQFNGDEDGFLADDITVGAVKSFISENKHLIGWDINGNFVLKDEKEEESQTSQDSPPILERLHIVEKFNISIVAFDDHFQDSELVYGIAINHTFKRVSLIFRGSVLGNQDWKTNRKVGLISVGDLLVTSNITSEYISKDDASKVSGVKFHNGFARYLFGALLPTGIQNKALHDSKFDKIVSSLKTIYEETDADGNLIHADYQFIVSGHSLGGALAQLIAFALGSSDKCRRILPPQPIVAVTYASPCVGNVEYNEAMQQLEETNILRHIRITNQGDLVPVGLQLFRGYAPASSGSNFHLRDGEVMEATGFGNTKTFGSQFNRNAADCHSLDGNFTSSYTNRLYYKVGDNNINSKIWRHDFEMLYELLKKGEDLSLIPLTFKDMYVRELRAELRDRGLSETGNKTSLLARLEESVQDEGEDLPAISVPVAFKDMNVKELKAELEARGLLVSGDKDSLIARLENSVEDEL